MAYKNNKTGEVISNNDYKNLKGRNRDSYSKYNKTIDASNAQESGAGSDATPSTSEQNQSAASSVGNSGHIGTSGVSGNKWSNRF